MRDLEKYGVTHRVVGCEGVEHMGRVLEGVVGQIGRLMKEEDEGEERHMREKWKGLRDRKKKECKFYGVVCASADY